MTGEAGARGDWWRKKLVGCHDTFPERVRLQPDITELQGWVLKSFGVSNSIGRLWDTLNKLGRLSFRKNVPCRRTDAA
jgi:hypothetical protein